MNFAIITAWLKQPSTVAGIATITGTVTAELSGQITWAQALPLLAGAAMALIMPDNTAAAGDAKQLATDAINIALDTSSRKVTALKAVAYVIGIAAVGSLSACAAGSVQTALASPTGQLFCALDEGAGGQLVVGVIDADATAKLGSAAPVAVAATNASAALVQSYCSQAAQAAGAAAGIPVSPPVSPVANVAIKVTPAS